MYGIRRPSTAARGRWTTMARARPFTRGHPLAYTGTGRHKRPTRASRRKWSATPPSSPSLLDRNAAPLADSGCVYERTSPVNRLGLLLSVSAPQRRCRRHNVAWRRNDYVKCDGECGERDVEMSGCDDRLGYDTTRRGHSRAQGEVGRVHLLREELHRQPAVDGQYMDV